MATTTPRVCTHCGRKVNQRLQRDLCSRCAQAELRDYGEPATDPNRTAWLETRPRGDIDPAPEWRLLAECAGAGPALFFPEFAEVGDPVVQAKAMCRVCPVSVDCLDYAMANHIKHGIWGGHSEKERRRIRRKRALARAAQAVA